MTAKDYLSQAHFLDQRINSKITQVAAQRELATNVTSTVSDMPRSASSDVHRMEDIILNIFRLESEINEDIDALVDLKREIIGVIKSVENIEQQTILEKRYLCFETWEVIAADMGYDIRWLYRLHGRALEVVETKMPQAIRSKTRHEKPL